MAKFKVEAKVVTFCYMVIEADSVEEANEIAENMDGGDFITSPEPNGYFEIVGDNTVGTEEEIS